ncbi:hypothetical protein LAUMK4_01132 [Mycobacterium persicum]|uniref:N-acetyltransferase domain-containing protein n=1 Tax=Mycobacterium persicum TaxID=1487726 RepID=A0ABY6RED6_9MYCO|nr:hypothetical protein LAUMK15_01486 [Mycobacterium persicum]VAZ89641.1 hypothetical protein LAUMK4_01132 [Mycobacterium persicum]
MTENIRRAILEDIVDIVAMVHHLAGFERVADQCMLTETQMYTALFGPSPTVRGHVVDSDGQVAANSVVVSELLHLGRCRRRLSRRSLCAAELSPPWPRPQAAGHTGRRMPRQRLHTAALSRAELEFRCLRCRSPLRRDRWIAAARVDHLSAVRAGLGCVGRTAVIAAGHPAQRRRAEEQYQNRQRHDRYRDPERRLPRADAQIPRHRQQQ